MEIKLGHFYGIRPEEHSFGCIRRALIWKDNRPVGHWSDGCFDGGGYLWLQNYDGYYHPNQFIHFANLELAINYAKEIINK